MIFSRCHIRVCIHTHTLTYTRIYNTGDDGVRGESKYCTCQPNISRSHSLFLAFISYHTIRFSSSCRRRRLSLPACMHAIEITGRASVQVTLRNDVYLFASHIFRARERGIPALKTRKRGVESSLLRVLHIARAPVCICVSVWENRIFTRAEFQSRLRRTREGEVFDGASDQGVNRARGCVVVERVRERERERAGHVEIRESVDELGEHGRGRETREKREAGLGVWSFCDVWVIEVKIKGIRH